MDLREEFLKFFENRGHQVYDSMGLIPDDATLLFANAGMVQFKDVFVGKVPIPSNPKATSCQLCVRAGGKHNDLENVGYTARHHTLFEMLGNFSFGDYFKKEAIAYAWEFITDVLKFPADKLWVTIHDSDDEAYELWKEHISHERIKRFGDKDNFWQMGETGACGPCSEIFYDQGAEFFNSDEDYLGGEGDRFLEIWNLVFMQYERDKDGNLNPLAKPSIDTGMGLERVQAILEGVHNNFDSSLFKPIIEQIETLKDKKSTLDSINSHRVIADHLRAVSFMLSHGVMFDKEGRGYVLRRILRRAVRYGYLLGFKKPFMAKLYDSLEKTMGGHYVELAEKREYIKEQITLEEERFFKTISSGMELFENELKNTKDIFSGEVAFKLYDTYGFPLDLTEDMLRDKDLKVDIDTYKSLMNEQKQRAKANWKGSGDEAKEGDFRNIAERTGINEFTGYSNTKEKSKIIALIDSDFNETKELSKDGWAMLDKTPFYAKSGGQEGDIGEFFGKGCRCKVTDTQKFFDLNFSKVQIEEGILKVGDEVEAIVANRVEVEKHHSATHLLQSALKSVLGDTVSQAGSMNDATRLRFDFTHAKALSSDELQKVENIVNEYIAASIEGKVQELPIEEAKKQGAIAMFGEKYGDVVRVVSFGDVSCEFCGGTHIKNSADIGSFYITKESGVSSGVRRIEAVCGLSAVKYAKSFMLEVAKIKEELKNRDTFAGIKRLKDEIKELRSEIKTLQSGSQKELTSQKAGDVDLIVDVIQSGDIKTLIDEIKNKKDKVAVMLFQAKGDKVIMAAGIKNASLKAGAWIKEIAPIVGGGGGGRDDFAQAGGKDASRLNDAVKSSLEYAKKILS